MKDKTPALGAEVLCKALPSDLHKISNLPTYHTQRLTVVHALRTKVAAIPADYPWGGAHD